MRTLSTHVARTLALLVLLAAPGAAEAPVDLVALASQAGDLLTAEESLAVKESRPMSAEVWDDAVALLHGAISREPSAAVASLPKMQGWGACVAVSELLQSSEPDVVSRAISVARQHSAPEWLTFLVEPLAASGAAGREMLATAWLAGQLDAETQPRALMHFVAHGGEARPHEVLLSALEDKDADSSVRVLAIRGLRSSTDMATALAVLRASVSDDRLVAGQATRVLRGLLSRSPEVCEQVAGSREMQEPAVVAHVAPMLTHPGWTGRAEWLQARFADVTDRDAATGLLELARALPADDLARARAALLVAGDDPEMLRVALSTFPDVMTTSVSMTDRVSTLYQLLQGWEDQSEDDPLVAHAFRMASWKLLGQTGVRTPADLASHIARLPSVAEDADAGE